MEDKWAVTDAKGHKHASLLLVPDDDPELKKLQQEFGPQIKKREYKSKMVGALMTTTAGYFSLFTTKFHC
ncbi:hypothetical protein M3M38_07345 [Fructilactobacillus cliffordii]|uniref:hypothetical protein n=1 Tax=Fructilactobacillus cliffordii TaxID=2940299 RepID=UPI00209233F2|nr:hypothetical protein [Fructilactobacillus cliffordii]USS86474.1 hypothetical protein M3M38_07345 [Fructilactobacillus cliffordii]